MKIFKKIILSILSVLTFESGAFAALTVVDEVPAEENVHGVTIRFNPQGDFAEPSVRSLLTFNRSEYVRNLNQFAYTARQCNAMLSLIGEIEQLLVFAGISLDLQSPLTDGDSLLLNDFAEKNITVDMSTFMSATAALTDIKTKAERVSEVHAALQTFFSRDLLQYFTIHRQAVINAFSQRAGEVTDTLRAMYARHITE